MKTVTKPETKRLIFDILNFEDQVDATTGKSMRRASFPKEFYQGFCEIRDGLIGQLEVGLVDPAIEPVKLKMEDISWIPFKSFDRSCGKNMIAERYPSIPLELSPKAVDAIKYFFAQRKEIPDISATAFSDLQELVA